MRAFFPKSAFSSTNAPRSSQDAGGRLPLLRGAGRLGRGTLFLALCVQLLAVGAARSASHSPETRAFTAAAEAFQSGFYERAETELRDFSQKFPASTLLAEAGLLQAQARIQLTNYDGAIELLAARESSSESLRDQYLFWLAEACFRKGDYARAGNFFARVTAEFPQSSRRLESAIGEAAASARLKAWPRVIEILRQPDGIFEAAATTGSTNTLMLRGYLLLGDACLASGDWTNALNAAAAIHTNNLSAADAWQRQFLICRGYQTGGKGEEALAASTHLAALAAAAGQWRLQAKTADFRGALFEALGRPSDAVRAYQSNLSTNVPPERRRAAILKITELSVRQNQTEEAAALLEEYLREHPGEIGSDLAWLSLGELRLRQHLAAAAQEASPTNPAVTGPLDQAIIALNSLTNPVSAWFGKAQLDLGWCYWQNHKLPEAASAFGRAVLELPKSMDQATALLKLAEVQAQLKMYGAALSNYTRLVEGCADLPEVVTNLFEPALYQQVRVALAASDFVGGTNAPLAEDYLSAATNAAGRLLAEFPSGFHTDRAALIAGQEVSRKDPVGARELLTRFLAAAPGGGLVPQVQLAIARTYEQQGQWTNALRQYDSWIAIHTNNEALPRAEYYRAFARYQSHLDAEAFAGFTNLVSQHPAGQFTPLAQWWIADYYFNTGDYRNAEIAYKNLLQSTNPAAARLVYQARMMAGRAANARQSWGEALTHFTNLTSDVTCPSNIWIQAMFAYGDTLMTMSPAGTNKLSNYQEAIRVFSRITELYPGTREAALAAGQKANCLLQWGQLDAAAEAFQQVIASTNADFTARAMAKVGLGVVLEKQAEDKPPPEQIPIQKRALDQYLDVFFQDKILRDGESPDLFWIKKAGLEAGRLAETLREWLPAIHVYERLRDLVPALRPRLDNKLDALRAQQQLAGKQS